MVRNLFIEPNLTPALNGVPSASGDNGAKIVSAIAGAVINPAQLIGPVVMGTAKMLDDAVDTTPGAARMLMAYTIGAPNWGSESYWTNERARPDVRTGKSLLVNPSKEG